jgi:hypothetical protein
VLQIEETEVTTDASFWEVIVEANILEEIQGEEKCGAAIKLVTGPTHTTSKLFKFARQRATISILSWKLDSGLKGGEIRFFIGGLKNSMVSKKETRFLPMSDWLNTREDWGEEVGGVEKNRKERGGEDGLYGRIGDVLGW